MRTKNTYSRFIQNVMLWSDFHKGRMIQGLHDCLEHDITSFDHSSLTGSETIGKLFGIALSESGLSRDEIQLISKYKAIGPDKGLVDTVEKLLLKLETDYLDLLLLKPEQLNDHTRNDLEMLMSQGKLVEVGGLGVPPSQLEALGIPLPVNFLPSPLEHPEAFQQLSGPKEPPEELLFFIDFDAGKFSETVPPIIKELAPTYNCSPQQLYLSWLLQHPAHLHPVVNYTEKEDLAKALMFKEKRLNPLDWQKIQITLTS